MPNIDNRTSAAKLPVIRSNHRSWKANRATLLAKDAASVTAGEPELAARESEALLNVLAGVLIPDSIGVGTCALTNSAGFHNHGPRCPGGAALGEIS